jgi:hypothetical protein
MKDVYEAAWATLRAHVGHDNPITARMLAQLLSLQDGEGSPLTRSIIFELIRRGLPIGATSAGYFVISNQLELEQCVRELNDRASATAWRAVLLQRAFGSYSQGEAQQAYVRWAPEPEERTE